MNNQLIIALNKFLIALNTPFKLYVEERKTKRSFEYLVLFKENIINKQGLKELKTVSESKVDSYLKTNFNVSLNMWKRNPNATLEKAIAYRKKLQEKLNKMNEVKENNIYETKLIHLIKYYKDSVSKGNSNDSKMLLHFEDELKKVRIDTNKRNDEIKSETNAIKSLKRNKRVEQALPLHKPINITPIKKENRENDNINLNDTDLLSNYSFDPLSDLDIQGEDLNALPQLDTTRSVLSKSFRSKKVSLNKTADLLPNLLDNAKILIKGRQGSGKSTLALLLMNDLAKNGNVLFISTEEKTGQRLKIRLLQNGITAKNIFILNTRDFEIIKDYVNSGNYQFIFIDSHNKVDTQQNNLINFIMSKPDLFFCVISRLDKTGKLMGSSNWEYELDTVIDFPEHGIAHTDKHRDGESDKQMRVLRSKAWYME